MTAPVERRLYSDRTIGRRDDDETGETHEGWADLAYESIRAMNHITMGASVPAPVAYRALGNLSGMAGMLPQLLEQLAGGLANSLADFDVYDRNREPADSIALAAEQLQRARAVAAELHDALSRAQSALADQGYNE